MRRRARADETSAEEGRREDGDIHIEVEDNGCGIPEGNEAKSFDAFYTTKADGLGMGLAISRTIIEAHGGRIWLSRNPTGGLTAHVTFPAQQTTRAVASA